MCFWRLWHRVFGHWAVLWGCAILLTILASVFEIAQVAKAYPDFVLLQEIYTLLNRIPFLFWISFFSKPALPAVVSLTFIAKERVTSAGELTQDELLGMLEAIQKIVGKKAARFARHLADCRKEGGWTARTTFRRITQPDKQYEAIVEAVWLFFANMYRDQKVSFHVVLARMGGGHIDKVETYAPPERPVFLKDLGQLQHDDAGFSRARERNELIIVPDLRREAGKPQGERNYRPISGEVSQGSMLCCPIRHLGGKEIPFVLSVKASMVGFFQDTDDWRQRWTEVMRTFETRISLEFSLEILRQHSK